MTRLFLVRHGETAWNSEMRYQGHSDIPLSEKGLAQARALSKKLAAEDFDAFYASDLSRARETAEIIAQPHGKAVITKPALRETKFGAWEGLKHCEIQERFPEVLEKWVADPYSIKIPDGESLQEVSDRVMAGLEEILKNHPDERVVIAAHGGTIRVILASILGMELNQYWRLRQDNTALNIVDYYGEKAIVALVNDISHLNGLD
ncbi:MAG: alpha-ribazole phosphatase [Clostridia bacterium]|nr:alpha-ribazole phosphatase [Clostridia bacterium]